MVLLKPKDNIQDLAKWPDTFVSLIKCKWSEETKMYFYFWKLHMLSCSCNSWGFYSVRYLEFYLFTAPHRWKCASSMNNTTAARRTSWIYTHNALRVSVSLLPTSFRMDAFLKVIVKNFSQNSIGKPKSLGTCNCRNKKKTW